MAEVMLQTCQKIFGALHTETLAAIDSFSEMLWEAEKLEEAIKRIQQACSAYDVILGNDHPQSLTKVYNIACMLHKQGRYNEAEAAYQRACEGLERALGEDHPLTRASVKGYRSIIQEIRENE